MKNLYCLALFIVSITVNAQTKSIQNSPPLTVASPESVGMSSERLARIDRMLEDAIDQNQIPGAVALIARNGKIVYHKAFGMDNPGEKDKFEKDNIFRIASQTKAITATAVMMLWEQGKFQLDDPISNYIPAFENTGILDNFNEDDSSFTIKPIDKPITIRHLITHTSGIGYGLIDADERFTKIYQKAGIIDAFTVEPIRLKENIEKLATMPLHHNPGEKWTYSEGLDVLGHFVEIISGMPFDQFLKQHIFDPLGMNDTYFYLPPSKSDRLVSIITKEEDKWVAMTASSMADPDFPVKGAKTYFSGGGGLSSTLTDYAAFLQMYLNKGEYNGVRLLSRTTVETIMDNQIGDLWGPKSHYGLAFAVVDDAGVATGGQGSEGTFSWGGAFNTQYFADPEEIIIGLLFKQTFGVNDDPTGWKFQQMVEAAVDN